MKHIRTRRTHTCEGKVAPRRTAGGVAAGLSAIVLIVLLALIGVALISTLKREEEPSPNNFRPASNKPASNSFEEPAPKNYRVLSWNDISYLGMKRVTARVVLDVSDLPGKAELSRVAKSVWSTQRGKWDQTTVFLYLSEMDSNSTAYAVVEFEGRNQGQVVIQEYALWGTKWYEQTQAAQLERERESEHEARNQSGEAHDYLMDLQITKTSSRTAFVRCETNLPEGTLLQLNVGREYWQSGFDSSDDAYAGDYFDGELAVKDGAVTAEIEIDDKEWLRAILAEIARLRKFTLDVQFERSSDSIYARALYTSNNDAQPADVVALLGKHGEFLGGELSRPAGKGRAMSVETRLVWPIEEH